MSIINIFCNYNYMFLSVFTWLEAHLIPCIFKSFTGIDCPGCGFQRSVVALLKGNLSESLALYPATIPILMLLIFGVYHAKYNVKYGRKIILCAFFSIATLILINYCIKMFYK